MNADVQALYRDVILDHSRHPRNFRALGGTARRAEGHNPLCGDRLTVYVDLAAGVLHAVTFEGMGCAIAIASASLMTEAVTGRAAAVADTTFRSFHALITSDPNPAHDSTALGPLAAFAGVRGFPSRVKCATLAWQALRAALGDAPATASTE